MQPAATGEPGKAPGLERELEFGRGDLAIDVDPNLSPNMRAPASDLSLAAPRSET